MYLLFLLIGNLLLFKVKKDKFTKVGEFIFAFCVDQQNELYIYKKIIIKYTYSCITYNLCNEIQSRNLLYSIKKQIYRNIKTHILHISMSQFTCNYCKKRIILLCYNMDGRHYTITLVLYFIVEEFANRWKTNGFCRLWKFLRNHRKNSRSNFSCGTSVTSV